MSRLFVDKVVSKTYTILFISLLFYSILNIFFSYPIIQAKDTPLATLMHKKFAQPPNNTIPELTTREAVGKTTPSKQLTSYVVQYKNLCITSLDLKYDTNRTQRGGGGGGRKKIHPGKRNFNQ